MIMKKVTHKLALSAFVSLISLVCLDAKSQQTNNQSSLTNQAAPSASSVTTGGTNINYQTNNTYQNEVGFGPGVFCRTPTLFIGGNYGGNELEVTDAVGGSTNNAGNFQINGGFVLPIGSRAIESCKTLADTITKDRMISTQLSMIKACADLQKQGIKVNPEVFPLLEDCTVSVLGPTRSNVKSNNSNRQSNANKPQKIKPQQLPRKVPQTTKS